MLKNTSRPYLRSVTSGSSIRPKNVITALLLTLTKTERSVGGLKKNQEPSLLRLLANTTTKD